MLNREAVVGARRERHGVGVPFVTGGLDSDQSFDESQLGLVLRGADQRGDEHQNEISREAGYLLESCME